MPGYSVFVAVDQAGDRLVQLDVCHRRVHRGATLFVAENLIGLMEMDSRGFRRLRPGAEGLLLLLLNGITRGGLPNREAIEVRRIRHLLSSDRQGYHEAARVFFEGQAAPAIKAAEAVINERWDALSAWRIETRLIWRAMTQPTVLSSQFLYRTIKRCPLLEGLEESRSISDKDESWLPRMVRLHIDS